MLFGVVGSVHALSHPSLRLPESCCDRQLLGCNLLFIMNILPLGIPGHAMTVDLVLAIQRSEFFCPGHEFPLELLRPGFVIVQAPDVVFGNKGVLGLALHDRLGVLNCLMPRLKTSG
jgi:hypothetical protein